jgi:hypothetical protein
MKHKTNFKLINLRLIQNTSVKICLIQSAEHYCHTKIEKRGHF